MGLIVDGFEVEIPEPKTPKYDGLAAGVQSAGQPIDRTLYKTLKDALEAPENVWRIDNVMSVPPPFPPSIVGKKLYTTRYIGQKFLIQDDSANGNPGPREYWFKDGLEDKDCVLYIGDVDLDGLATEQYVDDAIAGIDIPDIDTKDLTGDKLMAQHETAPPTYTTKLGEEGKRLTINQYADRQPGAFVGYEDELEKPEFGDISQDGVYFVREE